MPRSAKVAFSLDERLLERVERIRARTGETRSAVIARALKVITEQDSRAADVERYVRAYRERPETAEDEALARSTARRTFKRLPWAD